MSDDAKTELWPRLYWSAGNWRPHAAKFSLALCEHFVEIHDDDATARLRLRLLLLVLIDNPAAGYIAVAVALHVGLAMDECVHRRRRHGFEVGSTRAGFKGAGARALILITI